MPRRVPGDETPIPGPGDTLMVLEINGGLARRLGLDVGAELRHPALDQDVALGPARRRECHHRWVRGLSPRRGTG